MDHSESDDEPYTTVSSAPPKRRAGRIKFRETRHPVYKGIRQRADKWVCEVREPNKQSRIWLGTFPTAEMAARAHDVAAIALRGRSACLNFADSAWLLPVPNSTHPRDIQRAAAQAAEAFRSSSEPNDHGESSEMPTVPMHSENVADKDPFYVEDALNFGMQGYYDMAEGLMMEPPPPPPPTYMNDENDGDDVPLWNY